MPTATVLTPLATARNRRVWFRMTSKNASPRSTVTSLSAREYRTVAADSVLTCRTDPSEVPAFLIAAQEQAGAQLQVADDVLRHHHSAAQRSAGVQRVAELPIVALVGNM